MIEPIETSRLILRAPTMALAGPLVALLDNLAVSGMLARVPHPYRRSDADDFLARVTAAGAEEAVFAIHRRSDDTFMGLSSYKAGPASEFGYWLGEPYWRQGYMSEAAGAIITHAFRVAELPALYAGCRIENTRSRRILERLGFERTGDSPMHSAALGRELPSHRFILERGRWEGLQ